MVLCPFDRLLSVYHVLDLCLVLSWLGCLGGCCALLRLPNGRYTSLILSGPCWAVTADLDPENPVWTGGLPNTATVDPAIPA